jgi:DNA processing protein
VSGLALGIDGAAHRGALAGQGQTIAVLGSGLNRVQPQSHLPLGRQILTAGGLHVSEYPLNLPAAAHQFPERNRLISGLSAGVVVIEAGARSGSLITARLAAEQGREVMAVPGAPGLANSAGVNRLLKAGAALIETVDDVLDALGLHLEPAHFDRELANRPGIRTPELSPELARVLDALNGQAVDAELLAAQLNLALTDCTVRLTELELAGFVQRVPDGYIRRPSEF